MGDTRCSVPQAYPLLAMTWAPGARELCASLGQGRWSQQCSRLRLVFADLSPQSSPCADGDLRLGVLGVCTHKVARGPQDILALTLVSSWAWALVYYLAGHCGRLDSRVKRRPTPHLPGPLAVLRHLSLDQAVGLVALLGWCVIQVLKLKFRGVPLLLPLL